MNHEHFKYVGDATSLGIAFASLASWLPPVAALFSIVWTGMQIYGWYKRKGWK